MNANVPGRGLVLLHLNGGRFKMNQLLFAEGTALVTGSEENLCKLMSEYGRVCKKK